MEIDSYDYEERIGCTQVNWGQSQVDPSKQQGFSRFLRGYPMQGWGNVRGIVKPMAEAKAEVSVSATWGDKDDAKVTISGSVSGKDDHGNYAEFKASKDTDGDNKLEVKVGTEVKDK